MAKPVPDEKDVVVAHFVEAPKRIYDAKGAGSVIDVKTEGYDKAFARSAQLLGESREPIFEAGFRAAGALAFADVMLPRGRKGQTAWRMVEVKSSTSVNDYHREDVAVQTFIAQNRKSFGQFSDAGSLE